MTLKDVETFLEEELVQRKSSGLAKDHEYIKTVAEALIAVEDVITAAQTVYDWDDKEGFGSDDDGYNALYDLRTAIGISPKEDED